LPKFLFSGYDAKIIKEGETIWIGYILSGFLLSGTPLTVGFFHAWGFRPECPVAASFRVTESKTPTQKIRSLMKKNDV